MKILLYISTLLLLSCATKKNYNNDLVTPVEVVITLPGEPEPIDTTLDTDTNLYNQYQIVYKEGYQQIISISETVNIKDFLYSTDVISIDTIKRGVLRRDLD